MIVNHTRRFIFLKTKKTAGTSIEVALSRYCGPRDIVTRVGPRDERLRSELGYQGAVNHLRPREQWSPSDWFRHLLRRKEIVLYYNHMPASEVRALTGDEVWNSYFKFCVERNPWDRAISAYYWENRRAKRLPDFDEFLKWLAKADLISNYDTYSIDGRIAVDHVMLYERLGSELEELVQRLGLPGPLELPRSKGQHRKDRRPYQEVFTDWGRDFIARACAREIEAFGYRFER